MTTPAPTAPPIPVEVDEELVENVAALVEDGERGMVLNLVVDLRPADLARIVSHLPLADARTLFDWIPSEQTADVLPELESALRGDLLDDLTTPEIVVLLDQLETDDQADVLGDLAETDAATAEPSCPSSKMPPTSASSHALRRGDGGRAHVHGVRRRAGRPRPSPRPRRRCAHSAETLDQVYVVYAIDASGRFVGVVSLKRLLLAPARARLSDLAETDVVTVEADLDQEEVARIMERYDLIALPVVSSSGRLLGRITIDDVVDVIREEAEEDLQRAVGITGEEEISSPSSP